MLMIRVYNSTTPSSYGVSNKDVCDSNLPPLIIELYKIK